MLSNIPQRTATRNCMIPDMNRARLRNSRIKPKIDEKQYKYIFQNCDLCELYYTNTQTHTFIHILTNTYFYTHTLIHAPLDTQPFRHTHFLQTHR
jgi:hypothetical protein